MWEDDVLYDGERSGWSNAWFEKSKWLIDQLVFSRHHRPSLTHYVHDVQKKDWSLQATTPSPWPPPKFPSPSWPVNTQSLACIALWQLVQPGSRPSKAIPVGARSNRPLGRCLVKNQSFTSGL